MDRANHRGGLGRADRAVAVDWGGGSGGGGGGGGGCGYGSDAVCGDSSVGRLRQVPSAEQSLDACLHCRTLKFIATLTFRPFSQLIFIWNKICITNCNVY